MSENATVAQPGTCACLVSTRSRVQIPSVAYSSFSSGLKGCAPFLAQWHSFCLYTSPGFLEWGDTQLADVQGITVNLQLTTETVVDCITHSYQMAENTNSVAKNVAFTGSIVSPFYRHISRVNFDMKKSLSSTSKDKPMTVQKVRSQMPAHFLTFYTIVLLKRSSQIPLKF